MLILFKILLYGAFLSLFYGWELEFIVVRLLGLDEDHDIHFSITILLGMAMLSGLLAVWSFYWGISTRALIFFTGLAVLAVIPIWRYVLVRLQIFRQQFTALGIFSLLVFGVFSLFAFYLAAAASPTTDTGLYHAQSIHWIEYFHVVPGLANLHHRLGFNSSIFLLAAYWGFVAFGWHAYQIPGLIVVFCLVLFCLSLITERQGAAAIGGLAALGMLVYLMIDRTLLIWVASPTTDLPAAVITWIIFLLALQKIQRGRVRTMDLHLITIFALSIFDISIKLSAGPVVLLAIFFLWEARRSLVPKRVSAFGIIGSIILLPWIARNVALTGYIFFPFDRPDIFSFDWKVPPQTVKQVSEIITGWARIPHESTSAVMSLSVLQWFPRWLQALSGTDLALLACSLIAPLFLVIYAVIRKEFACQIVPYASLYIVGFAGILIWFWNAPSLRFGYGFLVPMLVLGCAPIASMLYRASKISDNWLSISAQSLLIVIMLANIMQIPLKSWNYYRGSLKPYPVPTTESVQLDGQPIWLSESPQTCWYAAFPCTPAIVPGLSMRGASLQDGFYIRGK